MRTGILARTLPLSPTDGETLTQPKTNLHTDQRSGRLDQSTLLSSDVVHLAEAAAVTVWTLCNAAVLQRVSLPPQVLCVLIGELKGTSEPPY
jgi:hypothetical protein